LAYAELREQGPVVWDAALGAWVVSRYEDIREVVMDPVTFSNEFASGPSSVTKLAEAVLADDRYSETTHAQARRRLQLAASPTLINSDPPLHKRQRALVAKGFTPRRVKQMEDYIQQVADELADALPAQPEPDLVTHFAHPLPMTVIARILGVPAELMGTFKAWTQAFTQGVGAMNLSVEEVTSLFQRVDDFYEYFTAELNKRRAEPQDDLLTDLLNARLDGETPLTEDELLQMLVQFLVAGNETTTNLMSSMFEFVLRDPELRARLQADPAAVGPFIEETLRLEAPTQGIYRTAAVDTEIAGQPIGKGEFIYLVYASANRDEEVFEAPDALELDTKREPHFSFGRGEHACLGQNLARSEATIAMNTVLGRFPNLALAEGTDQLPLTDSFILRGRTSVPVTL
jgi:cytochrome P450